MSVFICWWTQQLRSASASIHAIYQELGFDLASLLNAPSPLSFSRYGSSTHSRGAVPSPRHWPPICPAIESFVLTLNSFDSKIDRALKGAVELTAEERHGFELFMTEYDPRRGQYGADGFHCHGGPLFQSQTFANNGLDAEFKGFGCEKITGKE